MMIMRGDEDQSVFIIKKIEAIVEENKITVKASTESAIY